MCTLKVDAQRQSKAKKNPLLNYVELDTLGCGSFGRVVKVQKKTTDAQYAMKIIEKRKMEKVGSILSPKSPKNPLNNSLGK